MLYFMEMFLEMYANKIIKSNQNLYEVISYPSFHLLHTQAMSTADNILQ